MDLSYEDVANILKIIEQSSCEELHLEIGDFKLVVRKKGAGGAREVESVATVTAERRAPAAVEAGEAPVPRGPAPAPRWEPGADFRPPTAAGVELKAPMVGTFYRAPAPGAPPFVEVGSVVGEDDTVCIIEVMKLMNSIKAGCRGRVAEIRAENGALVEFGQVLMVIEPHP